MRPDCSIAVLQLAQPHHLVTQLVHIFADAVTAQHRPAAAASHSLGGNLLIERCRLHTADRAVPPAQTNIVTDGFRSLAEGEQVEFVVDQSDDGRPKAIEVTGPGGANPQVCGVRLPALPQAGNLICHFLLLSTILATFKCCNASANIAESQTHTQLLCCIDIVG